MSLQPKYRNVGWSACPFTRAPQGDPWVSLYTLQVYRVDCWQFVSVQTNVKVETSIVHSPWVHDFVKGAVCGNSMHWLKTRDCAWLPCVTMWLCTMCNKVTPRCSTSRSALLPGLPMFDTWVNCPSHELLLKPVAWENWARLNSQRWQPGASSFHLHPHIGCWLTLPNAWTHHHQKGHKTH